jgi:glycosyltransferase involved in cell wall biosynthesis
VTHTVDVIIPNYNGVDLLTACLDSLRRQTRRDFRVLVVDDASSDDSLAVLGSASTSTSG